MAAPRRRTAGLVLAVLVATCMAIGAAGQDATGSATAATSGAAVDCSGGCTFAVRPVCGSDGEWYQNPCLAACSGQVAQASTELCEGKPFPFISNHPGPAGAESAASGISNAIPLEILQRFVSEGFRYVGRIRLAHEMGPIPTPAPEIPAPPEPEADGSWRVKAVRCTSDGDVYVGHMRVPALPRQLESYIPPWMGAKLRISLDGGNGTRTSWVTNSEGRSGGSSGSARASAQQQQQQQQQQQGGGGFSAQRLISALVDLLGLTQKLQQLQQQGAGTSASSKPVLGSNSEQQQPAAAAAAAVQQDTPAPAAAAEDSAAGGGDVETGDPDLQRRRSTRRRARMLLQLRRLRELVGGDDRTDCQRGFPYTAIGQIQIVDSTGLYICTGTLIAPDKVLTAGHCVWNIKRSAFYYNLNFAPGRYRDDATVVNPWGVVPWKSVTVFDSFKQNPSTWDVAVVTLAKPLGSLTGYMGIAAGCASNIQLTTAGYPQDKQQGTCMAATCLQRALDCDSPTNPHVCDTKMGMSGSPLWDAKNRIRLIHVAGIEGQDVNRATTLTQFLVNTVASW